MAEQKTEGGAAGVPAGARGKKKIKKKEAVRRSLQKLGTDAPLKEIQADIKKRFGIVMTTNHISTSRGEIRKEAGKSKPASKTVDTKPAAQPARAAPANGKRTTVAMQDVLTLEALVRRVGADHLKTLIDVMSR
jgi:hypothetical protein